MSHRKPTSTAGHQHATRLGHLYARCEKRVSTKQNRRGSVRQASSRLRDTGSCNWNTHDHETQARCLRIEDRQPCLASYPGQGIEDHRLHLHEKCPTFAHLRNGGGYALLAIYVDDILITGPDKILLGQLKEKLMALFSMTDMGEVSLISGMKNTRDRSKGTLRTSLTDYTRSILDRFNMKDCNPVSTPSTGAKLSLDQPTDTLLDEDGVKPYQPMVGSLLYLSRTTRWDISYAVLVLTRATSKPSTAHLKTAKHVLRHLKGH